MEEGLRSTILFNAVMFFCLPAFAQIDSESINQSKYVIKAVRIDGDIELTGKLTDPHWKLAPEVELNYEVQPVDNLPAEQKTSAVVLYNSDYLYIGFICHDTRPSKIRAHVADRDNMFDDDWVMIFLDTYMNHQRAYEFAVNPLGIQGDLMRTGNNEDANFDAVWYSKGAMSDSGYTVEIALPFKSLRFPASIIQDWGIEFLRNFPRESRYQYSWVRLNLNDPCLLCQGGTLEGLEGLQSTGGLELLPYAMGLESGEINDSNDPNSGFSNGPIIGRFGIGGKYSPDPSLSIEGVANPDFSQVESDATQISVNSTFALFYPEKRPFFIEGNDIFNTAIQAYYSRMINNPLGAAKVIEKSGPLTLAYLGAEDRNSAFIIAGEEESVSDNSGDNSFSTSYKSFTNILRAKYDFGTQSFVGALATARDFSNAHNYVGGIDWNLFFGGNYTLDGQLLYSGTKALDDTTVVSDSSHFGNTNFKKGFYGQEFSGTGLQAEIRRDAKIYSFRLTYRDLSPTFQAEDGYIFGNDLRTLEMEHTVQFYPNTPLIDWWGLDLDSFLHFNYESARKERWIVPTLFTQLKSQTQLSVNYLLVNDELYHSVNFFGVHRWNFNLYTRPSSAVTLSLSASIGKFIYRSDNTTLGNGHNISAELIMRPTEKLSVTLDYSRSRLVDTLGNDLLFDGYISRLSAIYQFNDRVFVRLIGQYDQFNKILEIDPLFSYKLNPFTIFYAGSTASLTDYGEPFGIRQTGRQFFVKLQYLWRD
jgi:hypothetical protein